MDPKALHLTCVMQENLDPVGSLVHRDRSDPQDFGGKRGITGSQVPLVLAFRVLLVKRALLVCLDTRVLRALLDPLEPLDSQDLLVKKVQRVPRARKEVQGVQDRVGTLALLAGRGRGGPMDQTDHKDVRGQKEKKVVKGPWGLQETPTTFPLKGQQDHQDPQASADSQDHEEIKVSMVLLVCLGILAALGLKVSSDSEDPQEPMANQDPQDHLDVQDHKD